MPEKVTNISGGAVLFVVFLVLAAIFVVSPETRAKILEVIEYVYGEIRCLIFSECAKTEDDTTAIESTKALACAIDATAYWSDTSKKTELTNCLKDIEEMNKDSTGTYTPTTCKSIFQKKDNEWFAASCKDGKTEPPPTTNAIRANSGSIISKLIEWSGGGNKITGNAVSSQDAGNIITGHVSATPTTCTLPDSTTTGTSTCKDIEKDGVKQTWHCDSKAKAQNCGNKIMYTELTSAIKTHDICQPSTGCKKVDCSICGGTPTDWCYENECTGATSISKNRESLGIGTCKFVDNWPPTQDTCEPVQTTAQKTSEAEKAAEKVLGDNKGRAIAFGKTSVVCGAGQWDKTADKKCYKIPDAYGPAAGTWYAATWAVSNFGNALDVSKVDKQECIDRGMTPGPLQSCYHVPGVDAVIASTAWADAVNGLPGDLAETIEWTGDDTKKCWPDTLHCTVNAFELPQETVDGDTFYGPLNYISVVGDPKYVVINEKFPEKAAENWNIAGEDVAIFAIATAGATSAIADCALPGMGKALGKAGEKVAESNIGKVITKYTDKGKEIAESIKAGTIGRIFVNRGIKKAVKTSLAKETKENIGELVGTRAATESIDNFKKKVFGITPPSDANELVDELAGLVVAANNKELPATVQTQTKDRIKKILDTKGITKTPDELIQDAIDTGADKGIVKIYFVKNLIIPHLKDLAKSGSKGVKELDEKGIKKMLDEIKGTLPEKSQTDLAVEELLEAETKGDPVAKAFIDGVSTILEKGLGKDAATSKTKAAIFSKSLKGIGFSAKSVDITTTRGKANIGLVFAMIGAYKIDQMNNMRDPAECGTNTLCLYAHEWPMKFSAGMKEKKTLAKETNPLWIELSDTKEESGLYFASPCKADLKVKKDTCECEKFYPNDKVYTDVVIEEWGLDVVSEFEVDFTVIDTFNIEVSFPHEFNFEDGKTVEFDYTAEGATASVKKSLKKGDKIDDPKMLEDALRKMSKDELKIWVFRNKGKGLKSPSNEFRFSNIVYHNLEQGTKYKKCIKEDWWVFWKGAENPQCIKIEAENIPDYKPNFCFEKSWDTADTAEAGIFVGEIVGGTAAAILATPETLGAGAWPAYCAASMGVSAAGAWVLSGTMAEDKWPHGIDQ